MPTKFQLEEMLRAGVHFGHLARRWNPKMKPYIFMEKNGVHIIDLKKTLVMAEEALKAIEAIASTGREIMLVGTKKQAKVIIAEQAERAGMPYVCERWLGGMLTNFSTIRQSIRRMNAIERMETDGTFDMITKKERLMLIREKDKLVRILGGIANMNRLPAALFVVDIKKEHIAVKEARSLGIPIFAMVDTNCDPDEVDYVIPANDDAIRSIDLMVKAVADTILEARTLQVEQEVLAEMDEAAEEETAND
ncbi:MAG TPA: 30S ribosomal protein S2 [Chlorobaculum sp.]|jgi:small subunit ribosomal protein S2|uniref:Small ribosomal subunit protein uS2 n=1 Tax=Chlorobaculum tepidum (strain ATCC 49652 / DSM 12025 / NBRC 103806 / TLS) TaxID=194439 RepID=RS2_CHLTE|nr:30S ribosomal protein S2 [Chlorobaculum tepidum]Q8KBK6.1 RecName: Full=Small ribosomal subunit protein uS2; AltName: Full=30S ribosomal protein S2 [Chlorobaculum tepidum TLS]AAM73002.1 ribosomal protein S2 [Chlorobaculum tepidum TLS]HBU24448.1 30S ribosomal protein S2 [Chlorobaculum sp.]